MNDPVKTVQSPPPLTVSSLNYDVLCKILLQKNLSFQDIEAFSQTCKENWTFVFNNEHFLKKRFKMTWPDYDENYMEKITDYKAEFKLSKELQRQALDILTGLIRDSNLDGSIKQRLFSISQSSMKHRFYVEDFLVKVTEHTCPSVERMIVPLRSTYDDAIIDYCTDFCLGYLHQSPCFVS